MDPHIHTLLHRYDQELVKDELRPIVFEEVRIGVDEEMRVLLQNLKDMVEAERAAKLGKKGKKKKKKGKKKVRGGAGSRGDWCAVVCGLY